MAIPTQNTAVLVFVVATGVLMSSAWAHSPAPAPAPGTETAAAPTADCLANLLNMSDCVPYAEVGSNLTKPDKACCPELAGLVEGAPQCLCYLFDGKTAQQFGINVDMDRALKLPSVCSVATPPTSLCSLLGIPVPSPAAAPGASNTPGLGPSTAASPTTDGNDRGAASSMVLSSPLLALSIGLLLIEQTI
ncbi:non-specific lipid transfer protein GPI-anchored 2-like [Carica papaya]|uniref:non-specific lipid transfer protein GPI-anchored 2-like n=1 Tax=Carica papaya TaxID=3649 RepID=UPI000B8D0654|nr:non-specific lipid transfer protein GPI-anchored 2-like [Carica papaya]